MFDTTLLLAAIDPVEEEAIAPVEEEAIAPVEEEAIATTALRTLRGKTSKRRVQPSVAALEHLLATMHEPTTERQLQRKAKLQKWIRIKSHYERVRSRLLEETKAPDEKRRFQGEEAGESRKRARVSFE